MRDELAGLTRPQLPAVHPGDRTGFTVDWLGRFPRLLIAEDDDELLRALSSIFHSDGVDVFAVRNGNDLVAALEWVAERGEPPFDVLLTDLRMPGDNPIEVIRRLRRQGVNTPAIIMTAFDASALRITLHDVPHTEVFEKPFNINALQNSIWQFLAHPDPVAEPDEDERR